MSGRGSRLCRAAAVRGCRRLRSRRAGAVAQAPPRHRRRRRPTRPSSIRMRRSRRCPTSASLGPTSMPSDTAPPAAPTAGQAAAASRQAAGADDRRHPLHGAGRRPRRRRRCRRLLAQFRQQSALEAERKDPANAAQIGRRASADADLLDAVAAQRRAIMTRRSSRGPRQAGDAAARRPRRRAGPAISLRLGRAARSRRGRPGSSRAAQRLRGQGGRSGHRRRTSSPAASRSTQALGEQGFASAKIGEQDIEVNHQTHLATLTLPVDPGPGRALRHRSASAAVRRSARSHVGDHRPVQARRSVPAFEDRRSAPRADRDDLGRQCRHPGRAGRKAGGPSTSTCTWSRRRRTPSPASSATAPGRARGSKRAGPTAISSIPKAR